MIFQFLCTLLSVDQVNIQTAAGGAAVVPLPFFPFPFLPLPPAPAAASSSVCMPLLQIHTTCTHSNCCRVSQSDAMFQTYSASDWKRADNPAALPSRRRSNSRRICDITFSYKNNIKIDPYTCNTCTKIKKIAILALVTARDVKHSNCRAYLLCFTDVFTGESTFFIHGGTCSAISFFNPRASISNSLFA